MKTNNYFLPFTPNGKATENAAIELKNKLGFGVYSSINPYTILSQIQARLVELKEGNAPKFVIDKMTSEIGDEWSAIGVGVSPLDNKEVIFVNPNHPKVRQKVSLMEEVVHILLDHPRVKLQEVNGVWKRDFSPEVEDEAFNVGAACIIPYKSLFNYIKYENLSSSEIAYKYQVSRDYVIYRIKRAGLYSMFRKARTKVQA